MQSSILRDLIEQELLQVHTGFFGRIISVKENLATVQPLDMIKEVGGQPVQQAVIENCPIMRNVKKFEKKRVETSAGGEYGHHHTMEIWDIQDLSAGDIVYCACADRDISETRNGAMAAPAPGHHMLSSAVIVGVL
ncbi:MAG: hypothetical protein Q4C66_15205 [Lachnospiraceae bacterium]|nr:hypothetical protein [Lachnospiraceae bacterium]